MTVTCWNIVKLEGLASYVDGVRWLYFFFRLAIDLSIHFGCRSAVMHFVFLLKQVLGISSYGPRFCWKHSDSLKRKHFFIFKYEQNRWNSFIIFSGHQFIPKSNPSRQFIWLKSEHFKHSVVLWSKKSFILWVQSSRTLLEV